jgi:hypothetical protein
VPQGLAGRRAKRRLRQLPRPLPVQPGAQPG